MDFISQVNEVEKNIVILYMYVTDYVVQPYMIIECLIDFI